MLLKFYFVSDDLSTLFQDIALPCSMCPNTFPYKEFA